MDVEARKKVLNGWFDYKQSINIMSQLNLHELVLGEGNKDRVFSSNHCHLFAYQRHYMHNKIAKLKVENSAHASFIITP